jgi:uncharacterized membrane protein
MQAKLSIPIPSLAFKWLQVGIILLLVFGIFFRFVNIDRKIYWLDEVYSALRISGFTRTELIQEVFDGREIAVTELIQYQAPNSKKSLTDTLRSLALEDPKHPPLSYLAARTWMQSFGNSIASRRTLTAIYSVLSLPCMYWLCWELFKRPAVAWVAVALLSISPLQILYAQDAKQYSLLILNILLSSASLLRALRLNTRSSWGIYTITLSLGLYTHFFYSLVATAQGAYVLAINKFRLNKLVRNYVISGIGSLVIFSPWMWVILNNYSNSQLADHLSRRLPPWSLLNIWVTNLGRNFLDIDLIYYKSLRYLGTPINLFNWAIALLVTYSIYFLCRKAPRSAWLFVILLVGIPFMALGLPDLIAGGQRSTEARYLFPCFLGFQIAIAYLLATQIANQQQHLQIKQKLWSVLLVGLTLTGISSCWLSSQADVWWHQFASYSTPVAARVINRSPHPLVVSDTMWGHVLSLSHLLHADAHLQLTILPAVPDIAPDAHDVYLFRPSQNLLDQLGEQYSITKTPETGKLWRLEKKQTLTNTN